MTRYDAYIDKDWEAVGLARVFVSRVRDDGSADLAAFLVDLFCLGVRSAFHDSGVPEADLHEFVETWLPEELRERFHPACAKKLIEGAVAYAESLGFAPPRDFRKGRKVLSGIDASVCPREFTFGCDGRPRYVRGIDDTDERVNRICAILEARCGVDGFDYEDPEDDAEAEAMAVHDDLMAWLEAEPEGVPRFYEVSGLITAMLICPTVLSPLKVIDALWGEQGRVWRDEQEANEFMALLMAYWNQANDLVLSALSPDAPPGTQIFDIWEDDFDGDDDGIEMVAATVAWSIGFLRATELRPRDWGNAMTRPDLAPHWEVIGWWAGFEKKKNRDLIVEHAESKTPRALNETVVAIARALRPPAPRPA